MSFINELSNLHKKVFLSLAFLALVTTIGFAIAEAINFQATSTRFQEETTHITSFLEDNTSSILNISSQLLEQVQNTILEKQIQINPTNLSVSNTNSDGKSVMDSKSNLKSLLNYMQATTQAHSNAYESFYLVSRSGQVISENLDIKDCSFYKLATEDIHQNYFMDALQVDPISQKNILPFVKILKNSNNEFIGMAVLGLKPDFILSSFLKAANQSGRSFFLLSEGGQLLYRFPFIENTIGQDISMQPLWTAIKSNKNFQLSKASVSLDGVLRIGSSKKISNFPLIIGTTIPYQEVFDYWLQNSKFYLMFYVIVLFLIASVLYQTLSLQQKINQKSMQEEAEQEEINKNTNINESLKKVEQKYLEKQQEKEIIQKQIQVINNINELNQQQSKNQIHSDISFDPQIHQTAMASAAAVKINATADSKPDQTVSLSLVTGKLAHDFNNILTTAFGHLELSSIKTSKDHPSYPHIEKVQEALLRVKNMTKQILDFSRTKDPQPLQIDLVSLILDFEAENKNRLPKNLDLILHLPPTEVTTFADPNQIYNALEHIFTNSKQALADKPGRIDIRLIPCIHKGKACARISIKDNGPGIPDDIYHQIFDPFFSTKKKERGTGLGLTIAHGIINKHGGEIELVKPNSQPNNSDILSYSGAEFNIYLPLSSKKAQTDVETNMLTPANNVDKKIIVVDDEKALVDMIHEFLTVSGYQVESYTDPEVALENFKARPNDFAMAISDMTMPKISGDQLISEMHTISPTMPILVASGFSNRLDLLKDYKKGPLHILAKPFDFGEFLVLVKDMLTKHHPKKVA